VPLGALVVLWLLGQSETCTWKHTCASLRTIHQAEKYYREKVAGPGGKGAYWRADVAGLYAGMSGGEGPLKLIPLAVAAADDRPTVDISPYAVRSPLIGYWFRALTFEGEGGPQPDRFAVCAFADRLQVDEWAYLITHQGILYRKRRSNSDDRPEKAPKDPLSVGWEKVDWDMSSINRIER